VREKVLAAQRAGIERVILPRENEPDLEELPKEAREQLEFVPADSVDEVLAAAFDGPALRAAPRRRSRERQAAASA
jgi:ATP-dependent Lon protease